MSILDVVLDRRPEPKEETPRPLTMYGEDFDMSVEYWQEPILTAHELFPDISKPFIRRIIEPLATYRNFTNNQF